MVYTSALFRNLPWCRPAATISATTVTHRHEVQGGDGPSLFSTRAVVIPINAGDVPSLSAASAGQRSFNARSMLDQKTDNHGMHRSTGGCVFSNGYIVRPYPVIPTVIRLNLNGLLPLHDCMTHRTVSISSYASFVGDCDPVPGDLAERLATLHNFPNSLMLELSYPELDFANCWCWSQFGSAHGECHQRYSEYPACNASFRHSHVGTWTCQWLGKTGYNFGYAEWYFASEADRNILRSFVPAINFGENYSRHTRPKNGG